LPSFSLSCPWGEPRCSCCLGSLQSWNSLHRRPWRNFVVPVVFRPGAKGMATGGDILHPPTACACACVCIAFHSKCCPMILCRYLPRFAVLSHLTSLRGPLWAWSADLGVGNPHPLFRLVSPSSAPLGSVAPHAARVRRITSMNCSSWCPLIIVPQLSSPLIIPLSLSHPPFSVDEDLSLTKPSRRSLLSLVV